MNANNSNVMEVWKKSINENYSVSNLGNVRNDQTNRILKPFYNNCGYAIVELSCKPYLVSRLVGMAFIPNPNGKPYINHIDENPKNNTVFNLEWVTPKENINWGTCIERRAAKRKKPVEAIDAQGNVTVFESIKDAHTSTGIAPYLIMKSRKGEDLIAKGHKFNFREIVK